MSFLDSKVLRCALASAVFLVTGCVANLPSNPFSGDGTDNATRAKTEASDTHKTDQVAGFMRMRLGAVTITALYDGSIDVGSHLLKGATQTAIEQMLREGKQPSSGAQTAVNAFLIDDGNTVVLIDTGAANNLGAHAGKLLVALREAGYQPEDIQTVLLTHLHPDHSGGLLHKGTMSFPNAVVYAPQQDANHWLSEQARNSAPEAMRSTFWAAQAAIWPYQNSGRFRTFMAGPLYITANLHAVALPGHTPGHSGFALHSGNESILFWGDVINNHTTQLANPLISVEFDSNPTQARNTRQKALRELAQTGQWVAGAHMPFPGIGRVLVSGKGYRWLPLDYSQAMSTSAQRQP